MFIIHINSFTKILVPFVNIYCMFVKKIIFFIFLISLNSIKYFNTFYAKFLLNSQSIEFTHIISCFRKIFREIKH